MTPSDAPALAATLSPRETADALATGAVVRWWQTTSFLEVAGPDALTMLDGLCTQAVERINVDSAVIGLFLDAKAKVIAPTILHRRIDAPWTQPRRDVVHDGAPNLWLETLPDLVEPLRAHLVRHRLRARVTIETTQTCGIAVIGCCAVDAVGPSIMAMPLDGAWTRVAGQPRTTMAFTGSAQACARLVRELLPAAGVGLADPDALEADRIDAGTAGLHDLLPGRMPAEVGGMALAVALDAGCYLGQEPVARLHYRGRSNRSLRRLEAASQVEPTVGVDDPDAALALRASDSAIGARPLGRLTTWARRPDGSTTALAVLRREVAAGDDVILAGPSNTVLRAVDDPPS